MGYKMNHWKRNCIAILVMGMVLLGTVVSAIPAYGADKSALQTSVSQAEQMDVSSYTDETVALLQSALKSSAQVIRDEGAGSLRISNHVTLLDAVSHALVKKAEADMPVSGNYTINGILRQASSDNASMGNESITKPMELIVEDGEATLRLHFTYLTVPGLGQGYLADLSYLPDWDGMFREMTDAQFQAFQACTVEESYEGLYDLFNDPDTGIDAAIKGRLYPKYLSMPVTYGDPEVWTKVYVPIMESISAGGGLQYARLQLDWSTLTWIAPDKSEFETAVQQLVQLKGAVLAADYSQEMVELLEQAIVTGNYVQKSTDIGQTQLDAMTQALNAVANLFADAEKQYLYDMIQLAGNFTTSEYTDTYVADMKERIRTAQEVYNNVFATQTQVNEQYAILLQAISNAQKKDTAAAGTVPVSAAPSTNTSNTTTISAKSEEAAESSGDDTLDKDNLKDGVYAVTGKMLKTDKSTASMSNDAINHTIKLTVKKGKYKITIDFMGLNINGSFGYLSKLKYYTTGYTIDSYGAPQGTTKAVTVDSYQLDSNGERLSDFYGTDYPNQVTFPLIAEAVKDGYVPLQIYVPIMEAISAGTGTQSVFLYLDWDTLKSTTNDDDDFNDNQNSGQSNSSTTNNDLILNASLIKGDTSLTNGSSFLKDSASSSSLGKNTSSTLNVDTSLPEPAELLTEAVQTELPTDTVLAETADAWDADAGIASSDSSTNLPSPAAVPTVMSILMTAAGFLFKMKSRGGL